MRFRGASRTVAGLLLAAVVLTGCSREQSLICSRESVYLEARTAGPLSIPDDLSVPDASESLRIPEGVIAVDDEPPEGCLDHSPAFRNSDISAS